MDFSQASFFGGPQHFGHHHQFMAVSIPPPLTPSHSHSAASDDFNHTSPPDVYEHFSSSNIPATMHEQFQPYDGYAAHFNPPPHFPRPPTPPDHHVIPEGQPQPMTNGTAALIPKVEPETAALAALQARRQNSNSDDDDLTPAQSRRKAQNRAAQRAFRERKERHVKELEQRLQQLEAAQKQTVSENERLKRDLQKMSTENEVLRATALQIAGSPGSGSDPSPTTTGPMQYNPTDFFEDLLQGHANKEPSHRIVRGEGGERLLAAGAAWEMIVTHDMFRKGLVDVQDVSDRLKNQAKCDGQGPVFAESDIAEAIAQSVANGSDELL